ncbi:probable beta-1,3-galactosyltransferase 14 isoform X2 [Prosopis cineraria]|uniref:probable beta-1,3-galactosyltransferase 14 isoform X2 n=1 Tax=Prosopis cineraria TaxID=364024 RepID=UPI00240EB0DF|nr:probable beta-1,3-galactosyltransferase 14 isoform X2 [Prosopis cineraria]
MPSSPKSFYGRPPPLSSRRPAFLIIFCLLVGVSGFLYGITSFLWPIHGYRCLNTRPRSVRVVWEQLGSSGGSNDGIRGGIGKDRHKVMGFVGIQTGFGSVGRRQSLRRTWLPSDRQGLERLEEATGLAFRFIIGRTNDKSKMATLRKEIAEYDDFIQLDIEEEYSKLPYKTLAFFKAAYALFEAEFYVKADDDIYLRPDRLSLLLAKERSHSLTYIGCMKKGPVFTDPKLKCFRMFSNEDVTIGAWMLAMNVNHENNHGLCSTDCTSTSIAVWDIPKCSGLCNPEKKMLELHQKESCSKSPTLESDE